MEHRWGHRVPIDVPAWLVTSSSAGAGTLRDASISGGFIETSNSMPVGANLGVVVLVGSGIECRAVELPACVMRVAPDGFAVEWRDMACPPVLALLRGASSGFDHLTTRDRVFS
jgi:hypothetical protein